MNQEIEFYQTAHLDSTTAKLNSVKRVPGLQFAHVKIVECRYSDWWYFPFVGQEFLALLYFRDWGHGPELHEVYPVTLTGNTYILQGRGLPAEDIILL